MAMAAPRFLADESCDFAVVRALRNAGYDVMAVAEISKQSKDSEVIEQAHREGRILLAEDRDFGWLVFVSHAASAGVILIRFPSQARTKLSKAVLQVVREQADKLPGSFVVIQPGQIRISKQP
jgi:predicted nuclease of predicted toxin-antitoxin system